MSYSKVTSKFQTTIPKEIRKTLNISVGDLVIFETRKDGSVVIKKLASKKTDIDEYDYLKLIESSLSEWNSKEDDECFKHLQDI
ncbi:MAG: hypothetical protein A3F11_11230 [Gammaproteobacteria bacterium RIFCSPHIGHO2_12_FULL_37_14]|nr:MAG: hypothetical protein A3F11_11230 [Gammaproteobacteria bacterium RIFCSPHIGHO2_12_FULL_37_14]